MDKQGSLVMKHILLSRTVIWTVAVVGGSALGIMQPRATVASMHQSVTAGKPAFRFRTAADGNEARYLVREQLAGLDLPNDAVGRTKNVDGMIVFDDKGVIVRDSSKFVIDLTTLTSDKPRRDNFIKSRTLQTDKYPTATFVPFELRGLPANLPKTGTVTFQVAGQLTIHGVPRFTVWNATAEAGADTYAGTASTAFVFDDFRLEQPAVPVVLSLNDTIKLEYDFTLDRVK
jgi:polyisoprenoid-binding protein YceI